MSNQSSAVIFPMTDKNTLAVSGSHRSQEDDLQAFQRDFELHLQNLTNAIAKSKSVGSMASSIENKGVFSMLWGGLNGRNDKEFAQMAGDLAASLGTTQAVLQIVMQLNHRKNGVLREFHRALVDKISNITKDCQTLDSNQQEAALIILEQLKTHVSAQMEQQDMVHLHQERLARLDEYVNAADLQACELRNRIDSLESVTHNLGAADKELRGLADAQHTFANEQSVRLDGLRTRIEEHDKELHGLADAQHTYANEQSARLDGLRTRIEEHELCDNEKYETIAGLKTQLAEQKTQLELLKGTVVRSRNVKAVLLRNSLSLATLLIAAAALLRTM